jgi:hypothetical protein
MCVAIKIGDAFMGVILQSNCKESRARLLIFAYVVQAAAINIGALPLSFLAQLKRPNKLVESLGPHCTSYFY